MEASKHSCAMCTVAKACAFLALAIFIVYGRTLKHDFVNYDDVGYFFSNQQVKGGLTLQNVGWAFTTGHAGNWHPLTWLSLMLDAELFGTGPEGPHLTNVLLHAANGVLLLLLLNRLTGRLWLAAIVAALFALHPLRVESVAWISERKDVLSGFFGLLTLWAYACRGGGERPTSSGRGYYFLALLFFGLGLMSKGMLVTLPFVLLLLDYWPLKRVRNFGVRGSGWGRLALEKWPFFLMAAAACVATVIAQRDAIKAITVLPIGIRFANALVSYVVYIVQIFWPADLAVFYPYQFRAPIGLLGTGAGALLLVMTVWVLRSSKRMPFLPVGWFWYLGMLVPVIGFVQVGDQSHADRYTYLPQIGLYVAIVWAVANLAPLERRRVRMLASAAAVLIIAAFSVVAWKQTMYWRDSEALWRHALSCTPGNFTAYSNLGATLIDLGQHDEAIDYFKKAIELRPDSPETHNDWGKALMGLHKNDEAIEHFRLAIQIDPDCAEAHNNLANLLADRGETAEAAEHYHKAVQLRPNRAEIHNNMANLLAGQGNTNEALEHYEKAIELDPAYAKAHYNMAHFLAKLGRADAALQQFRLAVSKRPDYAEAENDWGTTLLMLGRAEPAIEHFEKAIQLKPSYAEAYNNLGSALAALNRSAEAIGSFERALEIYPEYGKARYNLAGVYATLGRLDQAISHYTEMTRLIPDFAPAQYQLGLALQRQGRFSEAIARFGRVLELDPEHVAARNNVAWLLATCPDPSLRNGARAVDLALQIEQRRGANSPEILDTLAAAYAEAGRYADAVQAATRALELAAAYPDKSLADGIRFRLALYQSNTPYREETKLNVH